MSNKRPRNNEVATVYETWSNGSQPSSAVWSYVQSAPNMFRIIGPAQRLRFIVTVYLVKTVKRIAISNMMVTIRQSADMRKTIHLRPSFIFKETDGGVKCEDNR